MSQIIVDYTALEELSRTLLGIKAGLDGISTTATEAGTYLGAANVAEAVAAFGGNWNRAREQISTMLAQVAGAAHAAGLEYQRLEDSLAHSAQSAAGDGGPFDPSGLLPGDLAAATAGAAATVGTSTPNAGLPQAEVTTVTIGTAADGTPQAEITTVTLNPDPTTGATDPGTTTTGSTGVDPGATGITAPTGADPTGGSATAIDPTGAGSLAGAGATDPTAATAGSGTAGDPGGGSAGGAPLGGGGGGLGSGGGGLGGGDLGSGAAATDPAAVASAATADPLTGGGSAGVSAAATAQPASGTASAGGHSNLGMVAMAAPVGVLGAAGATAWAIKRRRREEPAGEAEDVE